MRFTPAAILTIVVLIFLQGQALSQEPAGIPKFPRAIPGDDEIEVQKSEIFAPCEEVMRVFLERTGANATEFSYYNSKIWGSIVRATLTYDVDIDPSTLVCWVTDDGHRGLMVE